MPIPPTAITRRVRRDLSPISIESAVLRALMHIGAELFAMSETKELWPCGGDVTPAARPRRLVRPTVQIL